MANIRLTAVDIDDFDRKDLESYRYIVIPNQEFVPEWKFNPDKKCAIEF